jgi:predicted nucleic acid-binding protein
MTITIDASVWVAAGIENEPEYAASAACVVQALANGHTIVLPWLALPECVAAVARKTGSVELAQEAGRRLRGLPLVQWIVLDESEAIEAANAAAACRLRAAHAVYVAVAREHGATLVTLDQEVVRRAAGMVECQSPDAWVKHHSTG